MKSTKWPMNDESLWWYTHSENSCCVVATSEATEEATRQIEDQQLGATIKKIFERFRAPKIYHGLTATKLETMVYSCDKKNRKFLGKKCISGNTE